MDRQYKHPKQNCNNNQYRVQDPFYPERYFYQNGGNDVARISDYRAKFVGMQKGKQQQKHINQDQYREKVAKKHFVHISDGVHHLVYREKSVVQQTAESENG